MKRKFLLLAVVGMAAVGLVSCKKEKKQEEQMPEQVIEECKTSFVAYGDSAVLVLGQDSLLFRLVEKGSFLMGTTKELDPLSYVQEWPQHTVTLEEDFYLCDTSLPQWAWVAVMHENPSHFLGDDNRPVENVNYFECSYFLQVLNRISGQEFRLPTEEEWEYAARGGRKSKGYKYSGSNNIDEVAWHVKNAGSKTVPVKTKKPNELGLYDMAGNVWNWTSTLYGRYPGSPGIPPTDNMVVKGSGWCSPPYSCRITSRHGYDCNIRSVALGLRLAISAESIKQ